MIVAFPFSFAGAPDDNDVRLGRLFCALTRKELPQATIVQMTDEDTPPIADDVECFRVSRESLGQWYFDAMEQFPHDEFLRLDYDTVVQHNPAPDLGGNFDIAIAKERRGMMNNGVVFVKNREFFRSARHAYETRTNRDNWNAIQVATQMVIDGGEYRVKKLDPDAYNVVPDRKPYPASAVILHFKDARKQWMVEDYLK